MTAESQGPHSTWFRRDNPAPTIRSSCTKLRAHAAHCLGHDRSPRAADGGDGRQRGGLPRGSANQCGELTDTSCPCIFPRNTHGPNVCRAMSEQTSQQPAIRRRLGRIQFALAGTLLDAGTRSSRSRRIRLQVIGNTWRSGDSLPHQGNATRRSRGPPSSARTSWPMGGVMLLARRAWPGGRQEGEVP